MKPEQKTLLRFQFLVRVIGKECRYLEDTDQRLFNEPFTPARVETLASDSILSERVEAFVSRFSRLQDTLGDKLLPLLLAALGEKVGAAIDNLDRAERLDFIASADDWLAMRNLRNQMVHEYMEDPEIFSNALQVGHHFVGTLTNTATKIILELEGRGWLQ